MKKVFSLTLAVCLIIAVGFGVPKIIKNYTSTSSYSASEEIKHYKANNSRLPENLILVNAWNKINDDFKFNTITLSNGEIVSELIYPNLQNMFDDARNLGIDPEVTSGYRTKEKQQSLFDEKVNEYLQQEFSQEQAEEKAMQWVALPGFSEHHTGLAVDINAKNGSSNEVYDWLKNNSWKYGFILRYPEDKTEITGINYEPWHFRFVGYEAAEYIYEHNLCLEEYIEYIN